MKLPAIPVTKPRACRQTLLDWAFVQLATNALILWK